MRMWMVPTYCLCKNHLLGEHNELHKLWGCLRLGRSIQGYLDKKQLSPKEMYVRHRILVNAMLNRGMNHKSPLRLLNTTLPHIDIDVRENLRDLSNRCPACRENIKSLYGDTFCKKKK